MNEKYINHSVIKPEDHHKREQDEFEDMMSRASSNVSRYSHALAPVKTSIGTEISSTPSDQITPTGQTKDEIDFEENSGNIFGEIEVDDNDDIIDVDAMRRDTMNDLHQSELMSSVLEKPIEISDFELVKHIKQGTYGAIWKASLSGSDEFYVVKNFDK